MTKAQPELTLFTQDAHAAGFRLQRFEVFNWGSFHETVYSMPLDGENALLTGANGAGKTTLVDALITLLNPTPERYYNQSAGFEDRKRTRKLEDYVQGVFGHSENGREQLRNRPGQQAAYTVLLGVFKNRDTEQSLTLAHLYWMHQGELKKKYYATAAELNISEHFKFQGDVRKFSHDLSKRYRLEVFDTFSEYANYMQPRLGMRYSERNKSNSSRTKPLQLLAKTAGIKVLGNLDAFIREHMLDEALLDTQFDQLKKEFADLSETQKTLDKARKQEEMLMPLQEKNVERLRNEDELQRRERTAKAVGPYFARYHAHLIEQELEQLKIKKEQNAAQLATLTEKLEALRYDEYELRKEIDNHDAGRRLNELRRVAAETEKEIKQRQLEAGKYQQLADSVGLVPTPDAALFFVQRGQVSEKAHGFQSQIDQLDSKRDALVAEKSELMRQQSGIQQELESLRGRKNNLPSDYISLRTQLVTDLGIEPEELPFVAELVQVKSSEKQVWQHGLEKLLAPFSLHLLVPKQHLRQVIVWVRGRNTGVLLRFTEAEQDAAEPIFSDKGKDTAFNKLEVKSDSVYANWLKLELSKRFPHECTIDTTEYERKKQAVTPEGLIKHERQHQKDDRKHRINQYVLGWDNLDTIHRLETALSNLRRNLTELDARIQPLEQKKLNINRQLADLQRLHDIEQFARIDAVSKQIELAEIEAEIEALVKTSDAYKTLNERLEKVKQQLLKTEAQRQEAIQTKGKLEAQSENRRTELVQRQNDMGEGQELDTYRLIVEQYVGEMPELTLETVERKRREIESRLRDETQKYAQAKVQLEKELERMMQAFKNPKKEILDRFPSWPDDTDALGSPTIEHIKAYTDLLETIQNDALPKLAERFEARASQDMSKSFLLFERSLSEQLSDHEDHIKNMNLALSILPYTHDTYLQIVTEPNYKRGRIGEFCNLLQACQLDQAAFKFASAAEQQHILRENVSKIGQLIQRLDTQPEWRREVTDVRNWLSFKTQQVYQVNGQVVVGTLQDSTSGKSGGEQAKLTYTVLAAALTYQFNISLGSSANSFRFIVVDEAFSKLDPENSAYLLKLLSNLKFQMLIITPNNFSKTNEDLMSHLIYVQKLSETPPQSAVFHFTKLQWKERQK